MRTTAATIAPRPAVKIQISVSAGTPDAREVLRHVTVNPLLSKVRLSRRLVARNPDA